MDIRSGFGRRREIGASKEALIGRLMAGGLVLTIVSFGLIGIQVAVSVIKGPSGGSSASSLLDFFHLTLLGAVAGILMMVGGLAYGIYSERTQNEGTRQTEPNFRVLSRVCLDKNFQLLITDIDIEYADKPKYYVRGMLHNGLVGEFETTLAVFYNAGEGMTGEAEIQGKWLGSFVPYIGDTGTSTGEFVER